jgi:hypothetical protein
MVSSFAHAADLRVCFNYGCASSAIVALSEPQIAGIAALFQGVDGAEDERARIATALAMLHGYAAEQTPIRYDRPGNFDDDVDGRMDCIDHSSNSTVYLKFLEGRGLLKHHRVLSPLHRAPWLLNVHWGARIVDERDVEFAVDSWHSERGTPVPIVPLDAWMRGGDG